MRRAPDIDYAQLEHTLLTQHYVIARHQALAYGMTETMIRHRIRPGGPWQKILPGVYLAVTARQVAADQREMAALLHAGPRGVITGSFAAAGMASGRPAPTSLTCSCRWT